MSNDQYDDFGYKPAKQEMSGCAKVAMGCGIVAIILAIMAGVAAWWVARNVRDIGADFAAGSLKNALQELKLPEDQQKRIFARIDEVSKQFKDGEITLEEVGEIFRKISEGPLIPAGMVLVVERAYLDESGLNEEEQANARTQIRDSLMGRSIR